MASLSETHPPEENLIQIVSFIGIIMAVIFYSDISTPLGLMTWILYFIPLFLTLYIRWQYGPFVVSAVAIVLIGISYFLSPRDMSEYFALINRLFFSLMLILSSLLIWRHKKRELLLEVSEERYQNMVESSPEVIVIVKDRVIQYINPNGLELCGSETGGKIGTDCMTLFDPIDQEMISSTIEKAMQGAKVELSNINLTCSHEGVHRADVWVGEILWDGNQAIELLIRTKTE